MALRVLQWNCRSICKKLPELNHYLSQLATLPDLLYLQGTHLSFEYQPHLPHYTILCKGQPPHLGKGRGVCICVKNSIAYTSYHTLSAQDGNYGY